VGVGVSHLFRVLIIQIVNFQYPSEMKYDDYGCSMVVTFGMRSVLNKLEYSAF
jgi:hypothetical protein